MLAVVHTITGLAAGALAGWFLELTFHWPHAAAIGAACGCAGQVCRAALAWVSRPSDQTRAYQARTTTTGVLAAIAIGLAAIWTFLDFPATLIAPIASYFLVRVLLSWQHRGPGALSRTNLQVAARGGELITLLAALVSSAGEPLS
jgi:hypothetical protein